eukprot:4871012-Pyramimonas_sp.AAC.2
MTRVAYPVALPHISTTALVEPTDVARQQRGEAGMAVVGQSLPNLGSSTSVSEGAKMAPESPCKLSGPAREAQEGSRLLHGGPAGSG